MIWVRSDTDADGVESHCFAPGAPNNILTPGFRAH